MPKSAALCYTAALMKMRNCCERYSNLKEEPIYSSFLSYNYFNEVNYFQIPDVHVVNSVSKIMNATTSQLGANASDTIANNLNTTIINQNGNLNHFNTSLKNGHSTNGYANGTLNGHASSIFNCNNLTNGSLTSTGSSSSIGGGSPFASQIRSECIALEEIYRAIEFNPIVPIYLLQLKPLGIPSEHVIRRGDSEAIAYAFFFLKHWISIPGALTMLEKSWRNGKFCY